MQLSSAISGWGFHRRVYEATTGAGDGKLPGFRYSRGITEYSRLQAFNPLTSLIGHYLPGCSGTLPMLLQLYKFYRG